MPHVSIHYKMKVPAGHHRQPRNTGSELSLAPSAEFDVTTPSVTTPSYFPQLPYTLGGGSGLAQLLFWSITDGASGRVAPAGPLSQNVGTASLVITAWYWPISGPGGGDGPPVLLIDAFSAAQGRFIDDTFVTVTSDPSLTTQANVAGSVPTSSAQVLTANGSVPSTGEPFSEWIDVGGGTAAGPVLQVPAGTIGFAVAVYDQPDRPLVRIPDDYRIGGTLIGGVAVDGGGFIIVGGKPIPIDPWGPMLLRLVQSALVAAAAKGLEGGGSADIPQLAARDALAVIRRAVPQFEKLANRQ